MRVLNITWVKSAKLFRDIAMIDIDNGRQANVKI